MRSLHRHLQDHPGSWRKRLELAELLHVAGHWTEAVAEWQRVLENRPFLPAVLKLGNTLLKLGESEVAANVFRIARREHSQSAAIGRHLDGWIAICAKDADRSEKGFQAAADIEPENPVHLHGLALAHKLADAAPAALSAIDRALKLNSSDLVALSCGHEMLVAAGQIEEAMRRAQRVLKTHPLDYLTRWRLVDCRCRLGLTQGEAGHETKLLLRLVSRRSPNPFLVRDPLAAFLVSQGEPEKALAVHRRFVEQYAHCPRGREGYSRLLASTGSRVTQPARPPVLSLPPSNVCNGACNWCEKAESRYEMT
jgi:tetratricopeptide (TPR) repeat protein